MAFLDFNLVAMSPGASPLTTQTLPTDDSNFRYSTPTPTPSTSPGVSTICTALQVYDGAEMLRGEAELKQRSGVRHVVQPPWRRGPRIRIRPRVDHPDDDPVAAGFDMWHCPTCNYQRPVEPDGADLMCNDCENHLLLGFLPEPTVEMLQCERELCGPLPETSSSAIHYMDECSQVQTAHGMHILCSVTPGGLLVLSGDNRQLPGFSCLAYGDGA